MKQALGIFLSLVLALIGSGVLMYTCFGKQFYDKMIVSVAIALMLLFVVSLAALLKNRGK